MSELKKVQIDEIELYLRYYEQLFPDKIKDLSYEEVSKLISEDFNIECSREDIYLLYEPSIQEEEIFTEYYYKNVLGL
jgi:hypothetical protein